MTVWSNPFWNSADSVKPPMSGTDSSPIRPEADPFAQARRHMVDVQLRARDITDPDVLKVMGRIARERFAPADMQDRAYADYPLPIGWGQTISQPYIVALMTQLARPSPQSRALEIGVGSGYQTVILAALCHSVYGMEIVQPLADAARERLSSMGVSNVSIRYGRRLSRLARAIAVRYHSCRRRPRARAAVARGSACSRRPTGDSRGQERSRSLADRERRQRLAYPSNHHPRPVCSDDRRSGRTSRAHPRHTELICEKARPTRCAIDCIRMTKGASVYCGGEAGASGLLSALSRISLSRLFVF